jgi:hypothetical protein
MIDSNTDCFEIGLGGCTTPGGPGNDPCLNDVYVVRCLHTSRQLNYIN